SPTHTPPPTPRSSDPFTITAANQNNTLSSTQSFTLTVDEAPAISSTNAVTFLVGTSGSFTVSTNGGFPTPAKLSESGTLPANVSFVREGDGTPVLSGT